MNKAMRRKVWAFIEWCLDKKFCRVIVLVAVACIAYFWMGEIMTGFLESKLPIINEGASEQNKTNEYLRKIFAPAAYSVLIFLVLWWFRTIDTRQAIYQTNLETGLNMLASDTPIKIEMAVLMLSRVSKSTTVFNDEIRLAFIKRLKRSPHISEKNLQLLNDGYRWAYAQYILQWLKDHDKRGDLRHLDLRGQEFASTSACIVYADIAGRHNHTKYGKELSIKFGGCRFTTSTGEGENKKAAENFFGCYQSMLAVLDEQNDVFYKWLKSETDKSQPPTS